MSDPKKKMSRREMIRKGALGAGLVGVAAAAATLAARAGKGGTVWQIDPEKCIQCGQCATYCVIDPSAVKCVHAYPLCGYCDLCFGYFPPGFEPEPTFERPAAESQLCPTEAIKRRWVEGPHFEYTIDEDLCIGCGKCVNRGRCRRCRTLATCRAPQAQLFRQGAPADSKTPERRLS